MYKCFTCLLHEFLGALADIREGWRILRPGGFMLGHDAEPEEKNVYHEGMGYNGVRRALHQFAEETGMKRHGSDVDGGCTDPWFSIFYSAYIFLMAKGL